MTPSPRHPGRCGHRRRARPLGLRGTARPSGPVERRGSTPTRTRRRPTSSFLPDRPQPGATPEEIVEGFIRAGSGPGRHRRTGSGRRSSSRPRSAARWNPTAGVTIDLLRRPRVLLDRRRARCRCRSSRSRGRRERRVRSAPTTGPTSLPFQLAQQDDGEWRITETLDGIVLDRDVFPTRLPRLLGDVLRSDLAVSRARRALVPDRQRGVARRRRPRRTSPRATGSPTPSTTAFPESVTVSPSVPVESTASPRSTSSESALAAPPADAGPHAHPARGEPQHGRARRTSCSPSAVTPDRRRAGAGALDAGDGGPRSCSPRTGFGFLVGDELEPIPGLSEVDRARCRLSSIQVTAERDWAALRLDGRHRRAPGRGRVVRSARHARGLVDPTIDPFDVVWSVPRSQPAALTRLPAGRAPGRGGRRLARGHPDLGDGGLARRHADRRRRERRRAQRGVGRRHRPRLTDGVPVRLGAPVPIGAVARRRRRRSPGSTTATVGVLSHDGDASVVLEQLVGGPAATTTAPRRHRLDRGRQRRSPPVRLRGEDGALYVRRGTNWQQTAAGILVLATQQGTPQR